MKTTILRLLVPIKTIYARIFGSSAFLLSKRATLTYLTGNSTMHNSTEMTHVGVSPMVLSMYIFIMVMVALQIIIPNKFKREHNKTFRWLRIINIGVVAILATADCIAEGRFKPENAILVLIEIGIELLHPVLLPH